MISPRFIKVKSPVKTPGIVYQQIPVTLSPKLMEDYHELKKEFFLSVNGQDVEVISESAIGIKLRQYAQGFLYTGKDLQAIPIHDEKLNALVQNITPEPAIIVYFFKAELEKLQRAFPEALVVNGDTAEEDAQLIFDKWNRKEVSRLIVNCASVSEGLNLQYGGNHIYWYCIPWSLTHWDQLNGRLDRQGQVNLVHAYSIVAHGTKDEDVVKSLAHKDATQKSVLAALKGI